MTTTKKTDIAAFAVAIAAGVGAHLLFPEMHWGIKLGIAAVALGATLAGIKEALASERQAEQK